MSGGPLTLGTMKARIAAEIFRSDLSTQIANAINDAIDLYQSDQFYFNEPNLANQPHFNTVQGQATYTIASITGANNIPIFDIEYMTYVQGNATFKIERRTPQEIQLANQNGTIVGPPDEFCWIGEAITLYPFPDTAYPVSLQCQTTAPAPPDDITTNNPWMNDAEQLIRSHAKFIIAMDITKNAALMKLMSPEENGGPDGGPGQTFRYWKNLKAMSNRMRRVGHIAAMPL